LNTALTVEAGKAGSHRGKGWEQFTDSVIERLGSREEPIVFILWGNDAKKKMKWIGEQHQVLTSVHPSPLSSHRGFFGSKPFSQVNDALNEWGKSPIDWCL
jgi:uracil-DNA glycosylase